MPHSEPAMLLRPFTPADRDARCTLLAADAGEIWRRQYFPLHGTSSAQTIVAEVAGQMVGAASVLRSNIHPVGSSCAVDVHPEWRRQGIGTILLQWLRERSPDAFPLRTKVTTWEAERFIRAQGGRVYQVSNGETVPLANLANLAWANDAPRSAGVSFSPASKTSDADLLHSFVDLYTWVHASWNPVGSVADLRRALTAELGELDRHLSVVAWKDTQVVALALAFPTEGRILEVVAETTSEHQQRGGPMLEATIALIMQRAAAAGWHRLAFDGHITDLHLAPVLHSIPFLESGSPLLLMEIPA